MSGRVRCLAEWSDPAFDEWLESIFDLPHRDLMRPWALQLFSTSGPVDRESVEVAYRLDQLAAVDAAIALVIADLSVVSPRVPTLAADVGDRGVRVTVDGGYSEPATQVGYPFDVAETTVDIVEYIREHSTQDSTVSFPTCSRHEHYYLHPIVEVGVAVWHCRRGAHVVAPIGELPAV